MSNENSSVNSIIKWLNMCSLYVDHLGLNTDSTIYKAPITLGKLFNLLEPQFPHLYYEDKNSTNLTGCCEV